MIEQAFNTKQESRRKALEQCLAKAEQELRRRQNGQEPAEEPLWLRIFRPKQHPHSAESDRNMRRQFQAETAPEQDESSDSVAHSIHRALKSKRVDRLRAEEERRLELEHQKLDAEAQRQESEEEERIEQLKSWEQAWTQCERLRAFVARWEQHVEAQYGPIQPGSPADAWRRWAHQAIDRLDPFSE